MPRLRLFANLRELVGTAETEVPGATVEEVLANATRAYGEDFARGVRHAQVWVNGRPADPDAEVGDSDEVALIPPVSGGATIVRSAVWLQVGLVVLLAGILAFTNLTSVEAFAAALVAAAGLWAWDVSEEAGRRGLALARWPALAAIPVGAALAYVRGLAGIGLTLVAVVLLVLLWGVLRPESRAVASLGPSFLVALLAGTGVASLVVARLGSAGPERIWPFLAVVAAAGAAEAAAGRLARIPLVDPLTASSLGAVAAGAAAGWIWGPSPFTMLVVSVVLALAVIAGRTAGSLMRTGEAYLVEPLPGSLAPLDGPAMAAAVYTLTVALLG